jgi:outer membrane protein assembly factor BamB
MKSPLLLCSSLLLSTVTLFAAADWPQWRGPQRNGTVAEGPHLLETVPPEGLKSLWESEAIPSNDEGGLSSPVAAGGRVYLSVVWHSDVPSETRQIDEMVLRQLGYQSVNALGKEVVANLEETRMNISPTLRGKKLEDFAEEWSTQHLDKKQRQLYSGFVRKRFTKGKLAIPLEAFEALDKNKQHVFANETEMKQWIDGQGWTEDTKQQILAAVPPTRRIAEDVVICLDLASGKTLWKATAPGEPTGRGSSSTPCVADGKVFALGSTHAYCVDAATGKQLWAQPLLQKGPGSSPLYVDGVLVVNAKYLIGFDAKTGQELWKQEKAGGGNSSPVVWTKDGQTFVICNGRAELQAVEAKTGKIVWSAPGGGESTPAISGDVLAVQTRKPEIGFIAYKLGAASAVKLWNYPMDPLRTQSSPVIHGGHVYLVDDNVSFCFDATNGSQSWQEPLPASISSPIMADGKLFVMVNNGNTVAIIKPDSAARIELGRANVRGAWVPSPAIADGKLLVRLKDKLKCFDLVAAAKQP